jgi:hypothetical protein
MIGELRLMSPAGLTLRAACGRLSRSARLMMAEVKSSGTAAAYFKNHHSLIDSSKPQGGCGIGEGPIRIKLIAGNQVPIRVNSLVVTRADR